VLSRMIGAVGRALAVVLLIAMPSLIVPEAHPETGEVVAIVALVFAAITFVEYYVQYPSLIEFRYAPPFNRLRFLALFANILLLAALVRGLSHPSPTTDLVTAVGILIGEIIDFSFSPVRLIGLMLPPDATLAQVEVLRAAAGISYLSSLVMIGVFVVILRITNWPAGHGAFNVWVNMPNFDPTAGGDVVSQMLRDSRVNIMLGFSLPFVTPLFAMLATGVFDPYALVKPQALIWTVAIWAFIPASLMMRGIALARLADMLSRRRVQSRDEALQPG